MATNGEDLEFNPFYQALQGPTFNPLYDAAQHKCWLVCIPQATSLTHCTINKLFVEMHLLEPSREYRDRYHSVIGNQRVTWHMSGNELSSLVAGREVQVTVLSEELAYNSSLQQFKIFIVDRPLDPNYQASSSTTVLQDFLRVRRTFREQRELLSSFPQYRQPITELDSHIKSFLRNYMIVETESLLQDTASKLKSIAKQAAMGFLEANRYVKRLTDRRVRDIVWTAIEGYLLSSVHSKVYPAICGMHRKQEAVFKSRCRALQGKLTPVVVGLPSDYQCSYTTTLRELHNLNLAQSPLDGLYTLQDSLDNIIIDVKDYFTKSLRLGEPPPLASDDLIALLASIIVQGDCSNLLSSVYYMENFHWSLSDSDRLSFSLVTLRAAVEYIRGPEVEKLVPGLVTEEPQDRKLAAHSSTSASTDTWSSLNSIITAQSHDSVEYSSSEPGSTRETQPGHTVIVPPVKDSSREGKKKPGLGPFLSMLVNSDTVSSNDYS